MTINSPGHRSCWPCTSRWPRSTGHRVAADLRGTIQNDILKEYQAQKEWIFPPRPSMRLVTDLVAFTPADAPPGGTPSRSPATTSARRAPRPPRSWLSPSANGFAYVESAIEGRPRRRRVRWPRLSFFFNSPHRLLRGDSASPGGPPHLGPLDEGAVRGQGPTNDPCSCGSTPRPRECSLTAQQP